MGKRSWQNFIACLLGFIALLFAFVGCSNTPIAEPICGKVVFTVDGGVYATVDTAGEEEIALPEAPIKEGYAFAGWYFDAETWNTPFTESTLLTVALSSEVSVYAKWERLAYFDEELQGTQAKIVGLEKAGDFEYYLAVNNATESVSLAEIFYTNSHAKWKVYTDAECTQPIDGTNIDADRKLALSEGENTVYVQVTAVDGETQTYTLRFKRNRMLSVMFISYDGIIVSTQAVEEGSLITAPEVERMGYTFSGWTQIAAEDGSIESDKPAVDEEYSDEDDAVDVEPTVPVDPAPGVSDWDTPPLEDNFDFETPIVENITLIATWTKNVYEVTYDPNGGSAVLNMTVPFDSLFFPPEATRLGYEFLGWYYGETKIQEGKWKIAEDVTLTAKWTLAWYSIDCELGGGVGINPTSYSMESDDITLSAPTKTGYTFVGWIEDVGWVEGDGNEVQETVTIPKGSTGEKSYTAVWEINTYTIDYVLEGGVNHALNPETYHVTDETVLHAPTKEYYVFGGWYLEETYEHRFDAITKGTVGNLRLFAKWTPIEYTVKFDKNSTKAFGEMSLQTFSYGESKALDWMSFTYPGYVFVSWNTKKDGSGNSYADGAAVLNLASEQGAEVTLYATWKTWSGNIYFNANDGVGGAEVIAAKGNEYFSLSSYTAPTRTGYDFTGYYDAWGVQYVDAQMRCVRAWDKQSETLYAGWQGHTYTVRFHANGGTGEMGDQYFVYGEEEALRENTFQKRGYTFVGWRIDIDGVCSCENTDCYPDNCWCNSECECNVLGGECYVIANGESLSALTPIDGDTVILYATWELQWTPVSLHMTDRDTYFVRFNPNGGNGSAPEMQRVTEYSPITYPTLPTRSGYYFAGWYDNKDCAGEPFDFSATLRSDVTLYAKWVETLNQHTVSFESIQGGGSFSYSVLVQDGTLAAYFVPVATNYGYLFAGWYDNENCEGEPFSFYRPITQSITLYAKWNWNTYDSIPVNGTEKEIIYADYETYFVVYPLRTGWFTVTLNGEGNGNIAVCDEYMQELPYYVYDQQIDVYLEKNTLYYIKVQNAVADGAYHWATLSVSGNNTPEFNGYAEQHYFGGTSIQYTATSYTLPVPEREGYDFQGWYDGKGGTGTQYTDEYGNSLRVWDKLEYTVLYARWDAWEYVVRYDANDGYGEDPASLTLNYFEKYTLAENPYTRTGYTFQGWSTSADGSGKTYNVGDNVSKLLKKDGEVTFYAVWQPITVKVELGGMPTNPTVYFDLNGASGSIPSQTITPMTSLRYPEIPTRAGYAFAGWYTDRACTGLPYDFAASIDRSITLYAKWNELTLAHQALVSVGGNTGTVYISTEKKFAFVPLVSGTVTIYTSHISGDPYLVLYGSWGLELTHDDDGYGNRDSQITYTVTAGETYYIGFREFYESTCTGCLYITGTEKPSDGGISTAMVNNKYVVVYDTWNDFPVPSGEEGKTFVGWFDGENGTGTQYTDEYGNAVRAWDKTEDCVLYPKWI